MSKVILEVKNLTKEFSGGFSLKKFKRDKPTVAVDNLSFKIHEGEIVGLLGPNGAGKTTTIQMLLGTTTKTSGEIKYFGKDFYKHRSEIMEEVNYASAYTKLPPRLTVQENLMVYARIFEVNNAQARVTRLLSEFDMSEFKNKQVMSLSAGQTTRVTMAKAFLNYPKLLLLDEPTASLDPDIAEVVRQFLIKQQKK